MNIKTLPVILGHPLVPYQKLRRINKKEGYSQRNGVPLLWSNRKTVCGICVVSNKIKIKKFNFCNKNKKNPLFSFENGGFLVRVAGFEPTASWTRTMRATNCATPGYWKVLIYYTIFL